MGTFRKKESSDLAARAWEGSGKSGGAQYNVPVGCGQDWDDTLRRMEAHVRGQNCFAAGGMQCCGGLVFPHPLLSFFCLKKTCQLSPGWMHACMNGWIRN